MPSPETLVALAAQELSRRFKNPSELKPRQREVLELLARRQNVFAGLPTGYGKSVCFWAPAAAWAWRVWVISPLVSLIEDQAQSCRQLGIPAIAWHGGMGVAQRRFAEDEMLGGASGIVFLSPERLLQWWDEGYVDRLESLGRGPDLLALDEIHCFEDWRTFRPGIKESFRPIRRLAERGVTVLGLSASLSQADAVAWMDELCPSHHWLGSALGRENIFPVVQAVTEEGERWLHLVSALKRLGDGETAIVYCSSRDECDDLCRWLESCGFSSTAYHAGLPSSVRKARSLAFRRGLLPVVCATSAFGMGVDFPRVRLVVHFSVPYSLESYWQEIGRAGRDGAEAFALALWKRSDIHRARRMSEREREKFFCLWSGWASRRCRKQVVAESFGLRESACGRCDCCEPGKNPFSWTSSAKGLPGGASVPWWCETDARLSDWAREKIFRFPKLS